jgi:hypothetical protein
MKMIPTFIRLAIAGAGIFLMTHCNKKPYSSAPAEPEEPNNETSANEPPLTWKEHWFEHDQLLTRVYFDDDVVVYYDKDVNRSITWPFKFIGDVWRYTKQTYGGYGSDPRLYAIFHTGRYSGGHPAYYFDAGHDYRNVIDCGPGPWLTQQGNIDLPTHEVFHIVESTSFNMKGSPGFGNPPNGIWGDSKFAEIYQYDVYKGLGMIDEANRWYSNVINQKNDNPRPNTYWFRDWFYPIYSNYGETQVLVNFFKLLSQHFPRDMNNRYTRSMNWGEFVHFFSGAAGTNLKALATTAFGWPIEWEAQFVKAQADFPGITY